MILNRQKITFAFAKEYKPSSSKYTVSELSCKEVHIGLRNSLFSITNNK